MATIEAFQQGVRAALTAIHNYGMRDIEKVSWRGSKLALERYEERKLRFYKFIETAYREREHNPTFDNCMLYDYFGDILDEGDQKEFINGFISVINEMVDQSKEGTGREE